MQKDPSTFYDQDVIPQLYERLDSAFPEFGFKWHYNHWRATNKNGATQLPGSPRPDRVYVYQNRTYGMLIQGGSFVPWTSYINGGSSPKGQDYIIAIKELANRAGVDSSCLDRKLTKKEMEDSRKAQRKKELLEAFLDFTKVSLFSPAGSPARDYLLSRGFTMEALQRPDFPLGFYTAPNEIKDFLRNSKFTYPEIKESGVVYDSRWENRLIGVWRDEKEKIVTFFARALVPVPKKEKYLYLSGYKKGSAFGLNIALNHKEARGCLVIVEGLMDVLNFYVAGFQQVLGIGGAGTALTPKRWKSIIEATGYSPLALALDNDPAGLEGTLEAINNFYQLKNVPQLYIINPQALGESRDPDEYLKKHGLDAWNQIFSKRTHALRYKAQSIISTHKKSDTWEDHEIVNARTEAKSFTQEIEKACVEEDLNTFFWPLLKEVFSPQKPQPEIRPSKIQLLSVSDWMLKPNKEWFIERVLGVRDLCMLYGHPGSGKTFVALDLIMAVITGKQWANQFSVPKQGSVIYATSEGKGGLKNRLGSALNKWRPTSQQLQNFLISEEVPQLFDDESPESTRNFISELATQIDRNPDLLVIDTLHGATSGANENSAQDAGIILRNIRLLRDTLDCAVLFIHHSNKAGTSERGSSAFKGEMDTQIEISFFDDEQDLRLMHCEKLKDGESWKDLNFSLQSESGSCSVAWNQPLEEGIQLTSPVKREILKALSEYPDRWFSATRLAEAVGINRSTINSQLSKLVQNGEIKRKLQNSNQDASRYNPYLFQALLP